MAMRWYHKLGACVALVALLLIVIFIPISFQYVERNHWAFKKQDVSNNVDTGKVYSPGRYFWGVGHSPVTFPSTFTSVELSGGESLEVFSEGLAIKIEVSFQYRLKKDQLARIFDRYGLNYADQIPNNARTALRGAAATQQIEEFINHRPKVVKVLHEALKVELEKVWVEVPLTKFQMRRVNLPGELIRQKITTFVQLELQDTETRKQKAISVRKENERLQAEIKANVTVLQTRADAVEERFVAEEVASSKRRLEVTQSQKVAEMFNKLNVTTPKAKKQFLHYLTLLDSVRPSLLIGVKSSTIVKP